MRIDFVNARLIDYRALGRFGVEAWSDFESCDFGDELLGKVISDVFMDEETVRTAILC